MGKRHRRKPSETRGVAGGLGASGWRIVAVAVLVICGMLIWKLGFSPGREPNPGRYRLQQVTPEPDPLDSKFQAVISQFRCACGGCGELPLVQCDCDMPRGATTEKAFIREKLKQGLTVDEVIQTVDELYGHRIT